MGANIFTVNRKNIVNTQVTFNVKSIKNPLPSNRTMNKCITEINRGLNINIYLYIDLYVIFNLILLKYTTVKIFMQILNNKNLSVVRSSNLYRFRLAQTKILISVSHTT